MPCYDAPPEYAGDARDNAEQAVQILCALVQNAPSYADVPLPILSWFLVHRRIDLRMAQDPRNPTEAAAVLGIQRDIAAVEAVLGAP